MVVDEDPTLVRLCRLVLEREGLEVVGAFDGAQCLDGLAKNEIDLILLDLPLDDSSGWDLLDRIERDDRWRSIPVIVLSNLAQNETHEWGAKAPVGYLRKPFQIRHLLQEVRDSLVPIS